jgi:hypothetical protein
MKTIKLVEREQTRTFGKQVVGSLQFGAARKQKKVLFSRISAAGRTVKGG